MRHIILSILCSMLLTFTSCEQKKKTLKVHPTTEQDGYCYTDGILWYIFFYDALTGQYNYQGTQTNFTAYDANTTTSWTPTVDNVSNFSENESALAESISETTGENAGGSETSSENGDSNSDSGISESSGESTGGSDSSSDSGGGDSGGGGE